MKNENYNNRYIYKYIILKYTFFRITETDAEIEARMEKWDKYLEQQDEAKKEQETKSSNEIQKTSQWGNIIQLIKLQLYITDSVFFISKSIRCRSHWMLNLKAFLWTF